MTNDNDIKSDEKTKKWLTTNVLLLGLVSFFADLSGEMMTPILPIYIASLGGSAFIVGFIGGFGDAVANFVKVISGYLADKIGRRKLLIGVGYGIPFFAKFGIGLSYTWEQVLVLKPTERLGKGIRGAPRDSLLSDSTTEENLGKVFGFHRMMDTAGAVVGSFVALVFIIFFFGLFASTIEVLQWIIIISSFVSLIAVIPIFLVTDTNDVPSIKRQQSSLIQNLKELTTDYYKFLIISTLFGFANFTILLFILQAKNLVPAELISQYPELEIGIPIMLFIWFNLIYTILSSPFGALSDHYGRKTVYTVGIILFMITCLGFTFLTDLFSLVLLFGLYGAFYAATDGISKAFIIDLIPEDLKGTGIGLMQTMTGFTSIGAGIIAGFLMNEFGAVYSFSYGVIVSLVALILLSYFSFKPFNETQTVSDLPIEEI